jgi:hypothetical protein
MTKRPASPKPECPSWKTTILLVMIGFCLVSCAKKATPVSLAEYSTRIVGHWQGTVGSSKESMNIDGDGTFVCQIQRMGFLANTLSQSVPGKVSGTWNITGAVITLTITGEKHEQLGNRVASSAIESFKTDELTLKSDRGETSSFQRVISF